MVPGNQRGGKPMARYLVSGERRGAQFKNITADTVSEATTGAKRLIKCGCPEGCVRHVGYRFRASHRTPRPYTLRRSRSGRESARRTMPTLAQDALAAWSAPGAAPPR